MRLLLDTHAFLFSILDPKRVPSKVRQILTDPEAERFVSAVSLAEIAIKAQIGKLPKPPDENYFIRHMGYLRAQSLPLEPHHALALLHLPLHHRDPFDRLLIAQAREDGLTIATRDPIFARYEVDIVW